jgi:predicted nucleotidyltransferase
MYEVVQGLLPEWAKKHPILSGLRGSHVHGTYIPPNHPLSTDDIDVFTVFAHGKDYYLGLDSYYNRQQTVDISGDIDVVGYELRKYIGLLTKGNPNVHMYLWLKDDDYLYVSDVGAYLIQEREQFLSQKLFDSLFGYAYGQLKKISQVTYQGYMGEKRKKLVDRYGFDIKNAAHCVRLLYTGLHFASTGKIVVRLPDEELELVKEIKTGQKPLGGIERLIDQLMQEFKEKEILNRGNFPEVPDKEFVDNITRTALELTWKK